MPADITQRRGRTTPTVRKVRRKTPRQSVLGATRQVTQGARTVRRKAVRRKPPPTPAQGVNRAARNIVKGTRAKEREAQRILVALKKQARREARERRRGVYRASVGKESSFLENLAADALDYAEGVTGARTRPGFGDDVTVKATRAILKARRDAQVREFSNKTNRAIASAIKNPAGAIREATGAHTKAEIGKMGVGTRAGIGKAPLAAKDLAVALAESPGKTLGSTAKSVPKLLAGLAPGIVEGISDPVKAGKSIAKDYERRYQKAGTRKNVERLKREGALPEILDATTVTATSGRTTGAIARAQAKAPKPRPKLRVAPGHVREQELSRNAIIARGQRELDRRRVKAQKKRVERAHRDRDIDTDRTAHLRPEEAAGPEPGVVVPLTGRGAKGARERRFQEEQGRSRTRMRRRAGEEVTKGSRKSEAALTRPERRAFAYALEGHVPLKGTSAEKLAALERLEDFIRQNRRERGTQIKGRRRKKYNDELRTIAYLKQHVDEAFTDRLAKVVERERVRERALAADDPALATQQAELSRTGPQAEVLLGARREGETVAQYQARASAAREAEGLPEPGYFKHQATPFEPKRSDYALGTGAHGVSRAPRRRSGEAFRTGRRDLRMEVLHQSRAQNIKRAEQWNFVIRNAEENAIKKIRDADTGEMIDLSQGRPIAELVEAVDRSALNPNDLAFIKVGKLRKDAEQVTRVLDEEDVAGRAAQAFKENAKSYDDAVAMIRDPAQVVDDNGWHLVPRDIAKQQEAVAQQGIGGRLIRKYVKGIPSKLLLGTNPSWAILQVLNNQFLAALGGVGPVDIAKSARFFKKNPEARRAIDDYLGATPFEAERAGTRIGAAAPKLRLVEEWRAFKDTPLAQRAGRANPLDWFFRMDHANNTIHRRAVAYDFLRGEAYKGMGRDVAGFGAQMKRLEHTFDLGPEQQLLALLKNPAALEKAANHVDSLLGNYTRYSVWERRLLEQNVMFYGFLRFSLRFTLYTLPFKHPIKANILANLSRLHEREVRKMLGLGAGDPLPPGALATYYRVGKDGITEIPLQRLNPAMNVVTQGEGLKLETPMLAAPPIFQAAFDQYYHKDLFTGKAHKIRGESTARETESNKQRYPELDLRILAREGLSLLAPYREWERVAFEGRPQGADTLAWDPRPTIYKLPEIKRSINRRARRERSKSVVRRIGEGQMPLLFRESDIRRRTKQFLEDMGEAEGKKRPTNPYAGSGSSGSNPYR